MTILIIKANEKAILEMAPAVVFTANTKNTSTFNITRFKFKFLEQTAKAKGYDTTALFTVLS